MEVLRYQKAQVSHNLLFVFLLEIKKMFNIILGEPGKQERFAETTG